MNNQAIAGRRRILCPSEEAVNEDLPDRLKVADLREGKIATIKARGGKVAIVVKRDGQPRAFHAVCPHMGADLRRATCIAESGDIACPWHGYRYSSKTGALVENPNIELMKVIRIASEHFDPALHPAYRLREYSVIIQDGWLSIGDAR